MRTRTRRHLAASAALVVVAVVWGSSYAVVKDSLDRLPPLTLMMIRFDGAAVLLALLYARRLRRLRRVDVRRGAIIGAFLFVAFVGVAVGIQTTTASKQAFLIGAYVLMVPLLAWGVNGRRLDGYDAAGAVGATVGLALLTLEAGLRVEVGDLWTLMASAAFAGHMIAIDRYSRDSDPLLLTVVQFATAGLAFTVVAVLVDGAGDAALGGAVAAWRELAYLTVVTTVIAFAMQNVAQRYLSATTTGLILTLESAAGAVFAMFYLGETMTSRMLLGAAVLFVAIGVQETKPRLRLRAPAPAAAPVPVDSVAGD